MAIGNEIINLSGLWSGTIQAPVTGGGAANLHTLIKTHQSDSNNQLLVRWARFFVVNEGVLFGQQANVIWPVGVGDIFPIVPTVDYIVQGFVISETATPADINYLAAYEIVQSRQS